MNGPRLRAARPTGLFESGLVFTPGTAGDRHDALREDGKGSRGDPFARPESARPIAHDADPDRSVEDWRRVVRASAAQIGVEADFLAVLVRDGYIAAVAGAAGTPSAEPPREVSKDEFARFRAAKEFINETIVDALGVRAFLFTLKLERCSTRADLAAVAARLREGDRQVPWRGRNPPARRTCEGVARVDPRTRALRVSARPDARASPC